ncbi:MAG: T9SS type A sorting domain-containing protein [Bacteroidales bacterium]|nr:T9SS type A sorting domain-containing protein [Bacteroidales bacterium]
MKTVSKFLTTIMLLISSSAVFAQIELVSTFSSQQSNDVYFAGTVYSEYDYGGDMQIYNLSGIDGFMQQEFDEETNSINLKIYSGDFSSIITKTIKVPSFDGYKLEIRDKEERCKFSQHIFNNDDELECMVSYVSKDDDFANYSEKLVLLDSKGNIIKDFGNARYMRWHNGLYLINNQAYIIISRYEKGKATSTYEIYSVPTTVNPNQLKSATISNSTLSAFPNPAKTFVNLSYNVSGVEDAEMVITDASGRVVERRIVNAMQDNLRLNVANYKRGMYFYEVQGFTGRFIVE